MKKKNGQQTGRRQIRAGEQTRKQVQAGRERRIAEANQAELLARHNYF